MRDGGRRRLLVEAHGREADFEDGGRFLGGRVGGACALAIAYRTYIIVVVVLWSDVHGMGVRSRHWESLRLEWGNDWQGQEVSTCRRSEARIETERKT